MMTILTVYVSVFLALQALWLWDFWPCTAREMAGSVLAGLFWPLILAVMIVVVAVDVLLGPS